MMQKGDKRYDVFISYAHKDNPPPDYPISQLVEMLTNTYQKKYGEQIEIFFDKDELKPGELWEIKLLNALRQSTVMIVVLSEDYYNSEYCYKEWRHFKDVELRYSLPGDGIIPQKYAENSFARNPEKPDVNIWIEEVNERQHCDIRDWQKSRDKSVFEQRLVEVCEQIRKRKRRVEERKKIPTNVRAHNPNFSGRAYEIRAIHNAFVKSDEAGVITVLKGIGGIGKSTIAYEYAHAYIDYYQGGTFNFDAEGIDDFRFVLLSIAAIKGIDFTDEEKKNVATQCQRVWHSIKHGPPVLLILDNVDKPNILKRIAEFAPDRRLLHILVTSRQGFGIGGHIQELQISHLQQSLSIELLFKRFPAKDEIAAEAASKIASFVGGHPLALTMVGVFLANNEEMTYVKELEWLESQGIKELDRIGDEIHLEDYYNPVMTQLFEQVFSSFESDGEPTAEMRVLEYAALLPPDSIPFQWLYDLVKEDFPESVLVHRSPLNPWKQILKKLEKHQLLIPNEGEPLPLPLQLRSCEDEWTVYPNEPLTGTMHRLTQEAIRGRNGGCNNRLNAEKLIDYFDLMCSYIDETIQGISQGTLKLSEIEKYFWMTEIQPIGCLLDYVDYMSNPNLAEKVFLFEKSLVDMLCLDVLINITQILLHYDEALGILRRLVEPTRSNPESLNRLANLLVEVALFMEVHIDFDYNPDGIKSLYNEAEEIRRRLVEVTHSSLESLDSLASLLLVINRFDEECNYVYSLKEKRNEALGILRHLVEETNSSPESLESLASALQAFAGLREVIGDISDAEHYYDEALEIRRRLVNVTNPSEKCLIDLAHCLRSIAMLKETFIEELCNYYDLSGAERYYNEALGICRRLVDANHFGTESLESLARLLKDFAGFKGVIGDLSGADCYYNEALEIHRRLVDITHSSLKSLDRLACLLKDFAHFKEKIGDQTESQYYEKEAIDIFNRIDNEYPDRDADDYL